MAPGQRAGSGTRPAVEEITRDVFLVRASDVNCYLLRDGEDVTLVDAGYPADTVTVTDALENIGRRPQDVKAILITHAHIDHIGAVGVLHDTYGTPVYTGEAEVAHAHGDYRQQLTPAHAVLNAWRPGALPWMVRAARHGGTRRLPLPYARSFDSDEGALDLPGGPLPVTTRGHTSGHTAYLLPGPGAVLTGDALVTGHPLSRHEGPQLLPKMFQHDEDEARGPALGELDKLDAELLLPGHGDAWNVPMSKAVDAARGEG